MTSWPPPLVKVAKVWPPDCSALPVDREARSGSAEAEGILRIGAALPGKRDARAGIVAKAAVERIELDVGDRDVGVEHGQNLLGCPPR